MNRANILVAYCDDKDDCAHKLYVGTVIPATREDPGYWSADPPEECPECGGPMTVEEEPDEGQFTDY